MSELSYPPFAITPWTLMRKEQFLTLQYLLGLRSNLPSETTISCNELPNSSIKDVLFACIDTEFAPDGRKLCNQEFQFGLCILDTRDVLISAIEAPTQRQADLLKTYNFCVGSSEYCSLVSQKFLFGLSKTCCLNDIKPQIASILPNDRDIVLVTHDGQMDLNFAKELEISIQPIFMLDTQKVAQHPLQLTRRASLKVLLNTLQIPFQHMHVAGNDANFTLRALLLLGVRNLESDRVEAGEEQEEALVATLRAVAQLKRPRSAIEHASGPGSKKNSCCGFSKNPALILLPSSLNNNSQ